MASAGTARRAPRLVFSTDQLPPELDERARFRLWRELSDELYASLDVTYAEDQPFWGRAEFAQFGSSGVCQLGGTFVAVSRTARGIARDGQDDFIFAMNCSRTTTIFHHQHGRDILVDPGSAALLSHSEPGWGQLEAGTPLHSVNIPRARLLDRVANGEDLVARRLDARDPSLRLLARYLDILLGPDGLQEDVGQAPLLTSHVETTLLDLIALTLGAGRDEAVLASMRGLRAARLQAVLAEIQTGFARARFSVADVGRRVGVSARQVQSLLHETGLSFSERVMELRLQKARAMLASPHYAHAQVSQIAYVCGFNQVSYFNSCFRRRFGMTPTAARIGARLV